MDEHDQPATAMDVETHRVIKGRRWRVSDPRIPEHARQALVNELMSARRAVRDAGDDHAEWDARDRVHDAKVALGERGVAWWSEAPDAEEVRDRIRRAARAVARCPELEDLPRIPLVASITSRSEQQVAVTISDGADPPAAMSGEPT